METKMETKIKKLEQQLDFMYGRLDALQCLATAFIGLSPGAGAFVKKVIPQLAKSTESAHQKNQVSQLYADGFSYGLEVCSDLIDASSKLPVGGSSQRT